MCAEICDGDGNGDGDGDGAGTGICNSSPATCSSWFLFLPCFIEIPIYNANVASDQGLHCLHCLLMSLIMHKWVNFAPLEFLMENIPVRIKQYTLLQQDNSNKYPQDTFWCKNNKIYNLITLFNWSKGK